MTRSKPQADKIDRPYGRPCRTSSTMTERQHLPRAADYADALSESNPPLACGNDVGWVWTCSGASAPGVSELNHARGC